MSKKHTDHEPVVLSPVLKYVKYVVYGALFIIPFLPLIVFGPPIFPSFFFPFITGKGFLFRILVEVALVGWVIIALGNKRYRPQFSWTLVLYAAFAVWMLIADLFGVNPHKAIWSNYERMDGFVTLAHVFAFFAVTSSMFSVDRMWRKWWLTFLTAAGLVCLYGLLQVNGGLAIHQGNTRVDATLGNAAYLAAYLLFAIAVSLWQAIESKGWMRYSLYALTVLEVGILFATATRGAIIGLAGAAVLGAFLWLIESGKQGRKGAAIALVSFLVLIGGFFMLKDSSFIKNDQVLGRIASISLADGSTRFTLWGVALKGFMERPIAGWGQEGFNYVFNSHYVPSMYAQEQWFDRAHDVFLDWLLAGGLPALLLFLSLLLSAIYILYKGGASRAERIMLTCALAAYSFQALFVFDNLMTYVPLAALLASAHAVRMRPFKKLEALPEVPEANIGTVAVPIASVAFIAIFWVVNVPGMTAASDLISAITPRANAKTTLELFKKTIGDGSFATQEIREQLLTTASAIVAAPAVSNEDKAAIAEYAVSQMGLEIAKTPNDARLHLELAVAFRNFGDYPDAMKEFQRAAELSPNKQSILIEIGATAWQANDFAAAEKMFTTAYDLDHSYDLAAQYAAAGSIAAGNIAAGEKLLMEKFGTTIVDKDVIVAAYYHAKKYDTLIAILKKRVENESGSANSHFALAQGYALVGRNAEARAEVALAVKEHPEAAAEAAALLEKIPK
jgi:O-antigen ligase/Tfp pilus assembly protein PilF